MDNFSYTTDQGQPDEITRSPQMNAVLKEADKILEGIGDREVLREAVLELERVVMQMHMIYQHEARFEEKTPEFLEDAKKLDEQFNRLQYYIGRMKKFFQNPENRYVEEGSKGAMDAIIKIFNVFDALKEREMRRPVYSRSAFLNEVMRVADCVMRGTLPSETLRERLNMIIAHQENFLRNFDALQPASDEMVIFEENRDKIKDAVKEMLTGLNRVNTYFKDSNKEHIEQGLSAAADAADILADIEEKLKQVREAPKVKLCFKCGTENPQKVKYCVKCNFNFPPFQVQDEFTMDFKLEENGMRQTGHVMSEYMLKISSAVEEVKQGKIDTARFMEVVEWYTGLMEKSKEEAGKFKEPETWDSPESQEAFEQFRQLFNTGMEDIETGLSRLRMYVETGNESLLDTGLETILSGGDQLFQVHMASEQIKAMAAAAPPQN